VPIGRYVEIRVGVSHDNPYATSGGDARRSGRSRVRVSKLAPKRRFGIALPQHKLLPPTVLADGTLIVGTAAGVYALDPSSGAPRWFAPIGELRFSPSVAPSGELVAVADGKLVVLGKGGATRELALPFALVGELLMLDSGTVVVAARDGQAHALLLEGTELASIPTTLQESGVRWTARVDGDLLLAAGPSTELWLLSLHGGNARSVRLPERVFASPVVGDDGTIWVLGQRGDLFGIDADGEVHVSIALGQGGPSESLAIGWDGALRVGLRYGEVACFAADGKERWRRGVDGAPGPMLIDADDTLLFVSARGTLYAIDRDGELRWRQGLDVRGAGRPVLAADGTIYVVAHGGQLEAWR
jgi:outer membrane protein assembly factor BamB